VCGTRKDGWEECVNAFERHGSLRLLVDHLPLRQPQLEPECYEMCLIELLQHDLPKFSQIVVSWPPELYRVAAVITHTLDR
jgi:hypothetical protein